MAQNQDNEQTDSGSAQSSLARRTQMRRVERSMEKAGAGGKRAEKDQAETVINHLRDQGQIICVSDDKLFIDRLRGLICDELKMPVSCLVFLAKADTLLKSIRQAVEAKSAPLLLIEQDLRNRDMTFIVRMLKAGYPELKILLLTRETEKQRYVLLHESGVDGCIIKPVAGAPLLEKLALTLQPQGQVDRALEWARVLMGQGENLRALQVATQALEQKGSSAAVLLLMGDIFKAMKEYAKAADAYQKASRGQGIFLDPLRKLAELYAEMGQPEKQLEYLEKLDEISPLNLERKIQIGELALRLHKTEKARKTFDQAMKVSQREAHEHCAGVAYRVAEIYTESDPEVAAGFLQQGLAARRDFWSVEDIGVFNRLGLLLRRAGKWREATEEYKKALTVSPNDPVLHYNLAMAWLEGKEAEAARASALKTLALNPELPRKSAQIACNLASVFLATNDGMHALPLLRTALELEPDNAQARELLSKAGG